MPAGGGVLLDDAGEPIRSPFVPGGFNGGGGGGGGGGGFGGFGGGGFGPAFAPGGRGFNPLVGRRDSMRPAVQMPGVSPGVPGPTDTVHALLSPGEVVMNNGVTANPHMLAALLMLNMAGARGMQPGGGQPVSMAPQQPMGFAYGGMVPGGMAGWMRGRVAQPGAPKPVAQQPNGGAAGAQPNNGYTYNDVGGVTGGYNAANPWGQFTQNRDTSMWGQAFRTLGGFGQAGYFDPNGNQAMMSAMRDEAMSNARAQQQGAGLRAQLAGMDPGAAASYRLEAGLRGSSDMAHALSAAKLAGLQSQDQFAKNLYGQMVSGNLGQIGQLNGARLEDWQANNQNERGKKGQWGQLAGGILGQAAGSYLGRP